jgi:putative flippase GtrA
MTFSTKFFRFCVVGACTALLYYGLLFCFVEGLRMNATVASCIVYVIVGIFNYAMHHSWTFDGPGSHTRTLSRYLIMVSCGFIINGLIMYAGATEAGWNYLLVQTLAMLVIVLWNFSVSMLWVFRA